MKNQTDLIVVIVAAVLTIGVGIGMWVMKRDPVTLVAPTAVVTTPAALPAGDVVFAAALPGGGSSGGRGGSGGMGGMVPPGMGGMAVAGKGMMGGGKRGMMGGAGGG